MNDYTEYLIAAVCSRIIREHDGAPEHSQLILDGWPTWPTEFIVHPEDRGLIPAAPAWSGRSVPAGSGMRMGLAGNGPSSRAVMVRVRIKLNSVIRKERLEMLRAGQ